MIYWCLLSQLLQLCGEVMTFTFGRVKGTQNTADLMASLFTLTVHPHNLTEEGLIIP